MKTINRLFNTYKYIKADEINPDIVHIVNKKIAGLKKRHKFGNATFNIIGKHYLYRVEMNNARIAISNGHRVYVATLSYYRKLKE